MNTNIGLAVFEFRDHPVRMVLKAGDPWFVAADVCAALGYANTSKAIGDHLDDDERGYEQLDASRMGSQAVIINESGLYALVLRSRKPEARKFAKWVTSEVLPAIRKTGKFDVKTASGPMTKEMQQVIKDLVVQRAKALPHEKQAGAIIKAWSALKSHFGVSYKEIPADRYADALSLVARLQVEWEVEEEPKEPLLPKLSAVTRAELVSMCIEVQYLGAWWDRFGAAIDVINPKLHGAIYEQFLFAPARARSILEALGEKVQTREFYKSIPWHLGGGERVRHWDKFGAQQSMGPR